MCWSRQLHCLLYARGGIPAYSRGLELDDLKGPFQTNPSMILCSMPLHSFSLGVLIHRCYVDSLKFYQQKLIDWEINAKEFIKILSAYLYFFFFFSLSVKVKETHLLQASPQPYSHPGVPLHLAAAPSALVPPDGSFNYLGSVCTVWPRIARTQPEIGWGPSWVTLLNLGCSGIPNPTSFAAQEE